MADTGQPLAEVFGHLTTDHTEKAERYRSRRLCPFNNKVPNCTKDKAKNPLGLCSIYHEKQPVITCPIRFREDLDYNRRRSRLSFQGGDNMEFAYRGAFK
jgi:hypothetical protein